MKTKLLIMVSLFTWAFITSADDKSNKQTKKIEVLVDSDGEKTIKKIIVNGKELSAEEIKEYEASGKMKTLHMNHDDMDGKGFEIFMHNDDDSEHGDIEKHVRIIKTHMDKNDNEDIQIFFNKDGDKTTEKIIVNGKELSDEEIEEFKASGKMKVLHLDSSNLGMDGHKVMFMNSDSKDGDFDFDVIVEKIGDMQGLHVDNSMLQEWISEDGKNIKIIKKEFIIEDDGASLGFVATVEDDGWHLSKIMDKSGAKDAGILEGDIVKKIGNLDMTKNSDPEKHEFSGLPKFENGEFVKIVLERDGTPITFDVQARMLDKSKMLIELKSGSGDHFEWIEKLKDGHDISSDVKVMIFDSLNGDFKLNEEDIHMVFPENLGNMSFFISDGKSTSKLLGKHHEMSSLSDGLGKYFGTKGGVLVLHVDDTNVFALKDGDVVKSINDNYVDSPKDVVKQLIKADDQEKIKIKVIRNKKSKTLKYQK